MMRIRPDPDPHHCINVKDESWLRNAVEDSLGTVKSRVAIGSLTPEPAGHVAPDPSPGPPWG